MGATICYLLERRFCCRSTKMGWDDIRKEIKLRKAEKATISHEKEKIIMKNWSLA
jgi:hypothetical protein